LGLMMGRVSSGDVVDTHLRVSLGQVVHLMVHPTDRQAAPTQTQAAPTQTDRQAAPTQTDRQHPRRQHPRTDRQHPHRQTDRQHPHRQTAPTQTDSTHTDRQTDRQHPHRDRQPVHTHRKMPSGSHTHIGNIKIYSLKKTLNDRRLHTRANSTMMHCKISCIVP